MKTVKGEIIKNIGRNEIIIKTEDGKKYKLPRMSAINIDAMGKVTFNLWQAEELNE